MTQRKVFIVNDGGHDYSGAEKYGQIVFCTESVIRKDDISQMYRELAIALEDAKPDDYFLISSLTSLCAVGAAILSNWFGEVHFLLYKDGQYVVRDLILDRAPVEDENEPAY